jgi:hypothetical protein
MMFSKKLKEARTNKRFIPGEHEPASDNIPGSERAEKRTKPSPFTYGSGANRKRLNLPPITQCATSVPPGSSDASRWINSNAVRNRTKPGPDTEHS